MHDAAYFHSAHRYPLLTAEEEIHYGRLIQEMLPYLEKDRASLDTKEARILKRGIRARERMICGNMRLVLRVAHKYTHVVQHMSYLDLCQEGIIGLIRATEKFDPHRGYKFSTYAYWWIRQAINRSISEKERPVRIPSNMQESLNKISKRTEEILDQTGKMPTTEEVCTELGIEPKYVKAALRVYARFASLDTNTGNNCKGDSPTSALVDLMHDPDVEDPLDMIHNADMHHRLKTALDRLPAEEYGWVKAHYGLEGAEMQSYREIGKGENITREAVRLRLQRSFVQMKKVMFR